MQEYFHKINKTLAHTKNITSLVTGRIFKYTALISISVKIFANICEQALHVTPGLYRNVYIHNIKVA